MNITKSLKFGFLCSVEFCFSPFFFSYLFLFRVYFVVTSDITILPASSVCITECCQKLVLLNLWRIKHCGKFEIWFFSVLLSFASRLFFPTFFTSCSFVFFVFFPQQLLAIEKRLAILTVRQQISFKKKANNATE